MSTAGHRPWWVYLAAVLALVTLLWAGWSDFTPWVQREVVQETVRSTIRQLIQIVVQFVGPALLIGFLAAEVLALVRSRRKG
jgi:hypothetical protein